jgi:hypothetical protein
MLKKISSGFGALIFLSFILFGCTPPKSVHVDYTQRASKIRAIGILAPDITYYDVSFGGVREKNDKSSEQANRNLLDAVKAELSSRGFEVKIVAREGEVKQSLDEISGLFSLIAWSYQKHVLAKKEEELFPHKAEAFDYSVGPLDEILDARKVDALVLVDGIGQGNGLFVTGGTVILIALADRTGALLWFEKYAGIRGNFAYDIRDANDVQKAVNKMFEKMPEAHP